MKNTGTPLAVRAVSMCLAIIALAPQMTVAQRPFARMTIQEARQLEASAVDAINTYRTGDDRISHLTQAQDVQQLVFSAKSGQDNAYRVMELTTDANRPSGGVIELQPRVQDLTEDAFAVGGGVFVGVVVVEKDVGSLHLNGKPKSNQVFILKNQDGTWSAMINGLTLKVTRYIYKGLNEPFPAAARWDWERGAPDPYFPGIVVMGFPCAMAWCERSIRKQPPRAARRRR